MARLELVVALELSREKGSEEKHGSYSYRDEKGLWYLTRYGPTYANTYRVLEHTPAELGILIKIEQPPQQ